MLLKSKAAPPWEHCYFTNDAEITKSQPGSALIMVSILNLKLRCSRNLSMKDNTYFPSAVQRHPGYPKIPQVNTGWVDPVENNWTKSHIDL